MQFNSDLKMPWSESPLTLWKAISFGKISLRSVVGVVKVGTRAGTGIGTGVGALLLVDRASIWTDCCCTLAPCSSTLAIVCNHHMSGPSRYRAGALPKGLSLVSAMYHTDDKIVE